MSARRVSIQASARVRLWIDMTECEGRGLCAEVLPELITLDDFGFPIITCEVPEELEEGAREAVRLCPKLALRLERGRT